MNVNNYTYGHENILCHDFGEGAVLTIGKFCSIAANVEVFLGGNHRTDWITTFPFGHIFQDRFPHHGNGHPATKGNVTIGNDVWIGRGAIIMSGVTVGDGAVIAAYSVVTKDVAPYTIVAGNPARKVKERLGYSEVELLLKLRWWDWPEEHIAKCVHLLCSHNYSALLDYFNEYLDNERLHKQ